MGTENSDLSFKITPKQVKTYLNIWPNGCKTYILKSIKYDFKKLKNFQINGKLYHVTGLDN